MKYTLSYSETHQGRKKVYRIYLSEGKVLVFNRKKDLKSTIVGLVLLFSYQRHSIIQLKSSLDNYFLISFRSIKTRKAIDLMHSIDDMLYNLRLRERQGFAYTIYKSYEYMLSALFEIVQILLVFYKNDTYAYKEIKLINYQLGLLNFSLINTYVPEINKNSDSILQNIKINDDAEKIKFLNV